MYQSLIEINWNLLFSFITIVVLILLLRKFFFRKVHEFMEKRTKEVEDSLENARQTNEQADALLERYNDQMKHAEEARQEIIRKGRENAEEQAAAILADADARVQEKLARADREIERDKQHAREDIEKQMSDLVITAASKVLGETIDESKQGDLISQVIRETEEDHEASEST